jgi:cold shock CspA family protein
MPSTASWLTEAHSTGDMVTALEGAKVSYEVVQNRGKDSAENLRVG